MVFSINAKELDLPRQLSMLTVEMLNIGKALSLWCVLYWWSFNVLYLIYCASKVNAWSQMKVMVPCLFFGTVGVFVFPFQLFFYNTLKKTLQTSTLQYFFRKIQGAFGRIISEIVILASFCFLFIFFCFLVFFLQ